MGLVLGTKYTPMSCGWWSIFFTGRIGGSLTGMVGGPSEVGLWLGLPKARQQVGLDNTCTVASGSHSKDSNNLPGHIVCI